MSRDTTTVSQLQALPCGRVAVSDRVQILDQSCESCESCAVLDPAAVRSADTAQVHERIRVCRIRLRFLVCWLPGTKLPTFAVLMAVRNCAQGLGAHRSKHTSTPAKRLRVAHSVMLTII